MESEQKQTLQRILEMPMEAKRHDLPTTKRYPHDPVSILQVLQSKISGTSTGRFLRFVMRGPEPTRRGCAPPTPSCCSIGRIGAMPVKRCSWSPLEGERHQHHTMLPPKKDTFDIIRSRWSCQFRVLQFLQFAGDQK